MESDMKSNKSLANLTADATFSQITSADQQAAELLASIGLDPSTHSEETLRAVCQQRQWSEVEVLKWVKKHIVSTNRDTALDEADAMPNEESSLNVWITYLEETFINPNQALLKKLKKNFPRIHKIHGNQYPWLKHVHWYFNSLEEVLTYYYEFEKTRFLPLVDRLANSNKGSIYDGTVRKLEKSFVVIEKDQDRLHQLMDNIRNKGNQLENPPGACSTLVIQNDNFKILFSNLNSQFKTENEMVIPKIKEKLNNK